ncbi:MAG: DNA polymerase III subunit gamma/tau [Bacteroidota bacterium]
MEHFIVSARKYRPENFEDVVGQSAITNTLLKAIDSNHLAQALLFTGPRGVGKTSCARILAKKINQEATQDTSGDFSFNIFELDAASNNSVDDIRNLTDQVRIPPQVGKYKVYIIDEVHMLSQAAFNAFLKTLEEPPKHAIFILATTEKHKIIPTILSRCQIFDFKRITVTDIKEHLAKIAINEGVDAEDDALHIIAQKADGAMRDALSTYDRVVSFSGANLTRKAVTENLNVLDYETFFTSTNLILENNIPELLVYFNSIISQGFDGQHFISGLASHFRDLLVCKNPATIELLEVGEETKKKYLEQSQQTEYNFLMQGIDLAAECDFQYKNSQNQRLLVELCLMKLASLTSHQATDFQKKKPSPEIISPENFSSEHESYQQENQSSNKNQVAEKQESNTEKHTNSSPEPNESQKTNNENDLKEELTSGVNSSSGLSLSAIKRKKKLLEEQQNNKKAEVEEFADFTEEQIQSAWNEYVKKLEKRGNKILASILNTDTPRVNGSKICIELPNETMKISVNQDQGNLMNHLKKSVRNTSLELEIKVNYKAEKKFIFTAKEKYEKLKELNPAVESLRRKFDLDI